MEGRFELEGGGQLEVREEGARLRLSVRRRLDGAGLYKAWLRGERGEYLLGTLVPQGQFLCLERTVSRDTLSQAGCWPVAGGRTALAFSFGEEGEPPSPDWRWEHRPALRIRDPVLAEAAAACRELLSQRDGLASRPQGGASYYTSDRASDFQRLASLFLGEDVAGQVQEIDISKY